MSKNNKLIAHLRMHVFLWEEIINVKNFITSKSYTREKQLKCIAICYWTNIWHGINKKLQEIHNKLKNKQIVKTNGNVTIEHGNS